MEEGCPARSSLGSILQERQRRLIRTAPRLRPRPQCMAPTCVGDFALRGADLRSRGLNRIGNMLVPNSNYCAFEDWVMPILDAMLREQEEEGARWTPSRMIARLGREINHPDSIYYWAWRYGIPVFCPALTDGSLGDMLFFHAFKSPGLVVDIVEDIRGVNLAALKAAPRKTGVIILGGGAAAAAAAGAFGSGGGATGPRASALYQPG